MDADGSSLTDQHALQLRADLEQDLADSRLRDPELGTDLIHLHAGHALGDDPPRALRHPLGRERETRPRYPCGFGDSPGFAASPGFGGAAPAGAPPGSSASAGTASRSGSVNDAG